MADTPRRRLADRVSSSPTFVGVGSRFTGNLECDSDLVVGGVVQSATAMVRGAFTLSEGGRWEGKIQATQRRDRGRSRTASSRSARSSRSATPRASAARCQARSIAIAQGAVIEGDMAVTSGAPVVHYDRKAQGLTVPFSSPSTR